MKKINIAEGLKATKRIKYWLYLVAILIVGLNLILIGYVSFNKFLAVVIVVSGMLIIPSTITLFYLKSELNSDSVFNFVPAILYVFSMAVILAIIPYVGYQLDAEGISIADTIFQIYYTGIKIMVVTIVMIIFIEFLFKVGDMIKKEESI